ncbi:MAG: hypothetical protein COV67_06080, partial [Nitrospinae bacterium CG11_big_fil_rev_8_21_14_0_20_56_8]
PVSHPQTFARRDRAFALLIVLLGSAVFANHLENPLQFDSVAHVLDNPRLQHPGEILSLGFWAREFMDRSLMQISLSANVAWGGFDPAGFHLFNLCFHLLNAFLAYRVLRGIGRRLGREGEVPPGACRLAALIFLLHPIQTESVVYVMGRSEVLSATFYLAGFLLFQSALEGRGRGPAWIRAGIFPLGILACLALGFSVKPTVATLPFLLVLYYLMGLGPGSPALEFLRRWRWVLGGGVLAAAAALTVQLVMDETFLTFYSGAQKEVARSLYLTTQPGVVMLYYANKLVLPFNLTVDPGFGWVTSPASPVFLAGTALAGLWFFLAVRSADRRLNLFCFAWYFVVLSPSSSIVPLHDAAAEHRVYLAGLGLLFPCARLLHSAAPRPVPKTALAVFVLVLLSLLTVQRNRVWHSEVSLWQDAYRKSPGKVRPLVNLARGLTVAGREGEAAALYEASLRLNPNLFASNYNLAELYLRRGDADRALMFFSRAANIDPQVPEAHGKLGEIYLSRREWDQADTHLKRAVELNPRYAVAMRNLGVLHYFYRNDRRAGLTYFARTLELDPAQPGAEKIRQLLAWGETPPANPPPP